MDSDELEFTLLQKNEVYVYKIPPRPSTGHKANDWKECIWRGKLRITAKGTTCCVNLLDAESGNLFASCPVPENQEQAVERAVDSTRYFVLKVENGKGKHAFVGMGFDSRNDAFDFNCALSDFARRSKVEKDETHADTHTPSKDMTIKTGEKIHVELRGLGGSKTKRPTPQDTDVCVALPPPPRAHTHTHTGGLIAPPKSVSRKAKQTPKPVESDDFMMDMTKDPFADAEFGEFTGAAIPPSPSPPPVAPTTPPPMPFTTPPPVPSTTPPPMPFTTPPPVSAPPSSLADISLPPKEPHLPQPTQPSHFEPSPKTPSPQLPSPLEPSPPIDAPPDSGVVDTHTHTHTKTRKGTCR
eukprot:GHVR01174387.1.p1 GENE.GHVR01174387.1~~GHVR01174387.1.p1  ORF type:complete len:354 (+),score=122.09 GHVR01174387.1:52-1113(+)